MTDEEINRKFDVVADHLATLAVNQEKADERGAKSDARLDRLERVLMLAIRAGQRERKETREKINALIDAQTHTEASLARLAEAQRDSDERLDALIDIVKGNRNGNDKAS